MDQIVVEDVIVASFNHMNSLFLEKFTLKETLFFESEANALMRGIFAHYHSRPVLCVCQGAVLSAPMEHTLPMQPSGVMGTLGQQMSHLSLSNTPTVRTPLSHLRENSSTSSTSRRVAE